MKILTNNPKKIIGLDGFDLKITGREPIEIKTNQVNEKYLTTKRDKLGHLILGNNKEKNMKIAIVISEFNNDISQNLLNGAFLRFKNNFLKNEKMKLSMKRLLCQWKY